MTNSNVTDGFRIVRQPFLQLPLDEILGDVSPVHAVCTAAYAQARAWAQARMLSLNYTNSPEDRGSNGSVGEYIDMKVIYSSISSSALANASDPDITVLSMSAAYSGKRGERPQPRVAVALLAAGRTGATGRGRAMMLQKRQS